MSHLPIELNWAFIPSFGHIVLAKVRAIHFSDVVKCKKQASFLADETKCISFC